MVPIIKIHFQRIGVLSSLEFSTRAIQFLRQIQNTIKVKIISQLNQFVTDRCEVI
jgi:Asp-tRNA(Asn)/Glu-tRNA(Gln) amidotransferase C subunit